MLCVQFQIPSWNSFTLSISKAVNSNVCRGFNPPSSIINKSVQQPTGWKSDLFPPNTTGHHFLSAIPCIFDGTEPAIKGTLAGGAGTGNGSWFLMASLSDYLIALQKSIQDLFLREPNNSGSLSYPGLKPSPLWKGNFYFWYNSSNHWNTSKQFFHMQRWDVSSFKCTTCLPKPVSCLRLRSVSYIAGAGSHYWQLKPSSVSKEAHSRPMRPTQHPRLNRSPVDSCSAHICVLGRSFHSFVEPVQSQRLH